MRQCSLLSFPLLLFTILSSSAANALKGDNRCGSYMCVNATVNGDLVTYEMTPLFPTPPGWMALGWGNYMRGAHMVIMWPNADGSVTVSQRYAKGHREPVVVTNPPHLARAVPVSSTSWHSPNLTTMAFEVAINKSLTHDKDGLTTQHLIWAYGLTRPSSSSPDATLVQHFTAGRLRLDLSKDLTETSLATPVTDPPIGSSLNPFASHEWLVFFHGLFVSFGFLVLLPSGAIIARWCRTFTPKWFIAHQAVNFYIGLPIILTGWALGPLAVVNAQASHFMDSHQIFGFAMLFLYLSQLYLGRYIHSRPKKTAHPPSNVLHATFGTILLVLAFFQVRSGLNEWQAATGRLPPPTFLYMLWRIWAILVLVVYLSGLILLRRQFFQERTNIGPHTGSNYIALGTNARSPFIAPPGLVFDAEIDSLGLYEVPESDFTSKEAEAVSIPLLHGRQ